jgi:hypothetical protein
MLEEGVYEKKIAVGGLEYSGHCGGVFWEFCSSGFDEQTGEMLLFT